DAALPARHPRRADQAGWPTRPRGRERGHRPATRFAGKRSDLVAPAIAGGRPQGERKKMIRSHSARLAAVVAGLAALSLAAAALSLSSSHRQTNTRRNS